MSTLGNIVGGCLASAGLVLLLLLIAGVEVGVPVNNAECWHGRTVDSAFRPCENAP